MELPSKDYRGMKLCQSCWDGWHDDSKGDTHCSAGTCECPCRQLREERLSRPRKDKTLQSNIADVIGDDVIVIGEPTVAHRDDA